MTKGLHNNSLRKVDNPHQWMIDDARMKLIQQIKAEVERRKVDYLNRSYTFVPKAMQDLLDFLSDLEKSEKPNDQWSEEDNIMVKDIINAIDKNYASSDWHEMVDWLKSLHLKVKSEKPINPVIQDFPTTEKEMQDFLATHERIPVPERLNSLERILQEQPVCEGLEEEISRYLREDCSDDDEPSISEVARHFAKWGAEHLKK